MRIMGLDFGSKTIGVAISDELLLTAQGIEISIVTLIDFATLFFTPSGFPFAKSLDIPGMRAVAIADAIAMGILEIFVPLAIALRLVATTASSIPFTFIIICW